MSVLHFSCNLTCSDLLMGFSLYVIQMAHVNPFACSENLNKLGAFCTPCIKYLIGKQFFAFQEKGLDYCLPFSELAW